MRCITSQCVQWSLLSTFQYVGITGWKSGQAPNEATTLCLLLLALHVLGLSWDHITVNAHCLP